MKGDINLDGKVTIDDYYMALDAVFPEESGVILTTQQKANADIDGDGVVTMKDVDDIKAMIGMGGKTNWIPFIIGGLALLALILVTKK